MLVEFCTFFCIDTFYQFGSGILSVLALIDDIDCSCSGTSFVHVGFFTTQMQAATFHDLVPSIGMIGHGVEKYTVHIEKYGFQPNVRVPMVFQITGNSDFKHNLLLYRAQNYTKSVFKL